MLRFHKLCNSLFFSLCTFLVGKGNDQVHFVSVFTDFSCKLYFWSFPICSCLDIYRLILPWCPGLQGEIMLSVRDWRVWKVQRAECLVSRKMNACMTLPMGASLLQQLYHCSSTDKTSSNQEMTEHWVTWSQATNSFAGCTIVD